MLTNQPKIIKNTIREHHWSHWSTRKFLQDTQTSHAMQITSHAGFSRKDREKSRIITYLIQGSDQTDLEISS